ncbi:hypothetical protein C0J52_23898 [Blattella germanica]|nr:hypothetical protein C0J52_23898 [Blattella germanica]
MIKYFFLICRRIIIQERYDDSVKPVSPDNVWISKHYRWPVYEFAEAVECHRETHHPTMCNCPTAEIYVNLEFDMRAAKENRFMSPFTRVLLTPHPFRAVQPRPVLAFCKSHELQRICLEAGATVAGDTELIKNVQNGDLNLKDFQFVVAHPNIMTEISAIRGLLKGRFPNPKRGTLGSNIGDIVSRFSNGIEYSVKLQPSSNDFGWMFTAFGKLDMETSQLEENFTALLKDVHSMKPKRDGEFITKCCLVSLPSIERLKVDFKKYIGENEDSTSDEQSDDESSDEETDKKEKTAASAVAS